MGCLGWVLLAPFGGLAWGAYKVGDYFIKRGNKPLGVFLSFLLGGLCSGLGYCLAYVGWIEQRGLEAYRITYPIAGWFGIVVGGLAIVVEISRILTMTKEDVEMEELAEKLKKKSSSDEDKQPRS
jgi:hypothetical protein